MRQFVVAFATTGNTPKDGHRFSEIVLVGQEDGRLNDQRAAFKLGEAAGQVAFPAALSAIKALVGDAQIVVHDAGKWRRFLRAELRTIKRHGATNLMSNVVDVGAWAHQRFPRQRRDVAAIARKAGVAVPAHISGLELEAELLRRIGNVMTRSAVAEESAIVAVNALETTAVVAIPIRQGWAERIGNFWRGLTVRA